MATAEYTIYVDWDGDGSLEEIAFLTPWFPVQQGDVEDVTAYVRANPGIRTVRGRDQIRALAPPMAGAADCELDNQERIFSPENIDSLLYGNLIPGRQMQVRALYSGTNYTLWTGYLDDIPQHPERERHSVSIPALGAFSKLAGKRVSTALYSSIRTDEALGYLLDAVGWSGSDRVLDVGKTTLDWWWLQDEDAFDAAKALLNTEGPGSTLYEDGSGNIVFESRHYRLITTRSTTSQATLSDVGSEPLFAAPFSYNPGLKDIINIAEVTTKTRAAQSASVVWSLGQTITLVANETRKYVATNTDPFTGAITPIANTDYTVTVGDLSSITLDRTSGQSCTITLTAGASGATVAGLQLRAQLVTVQNTIIVANTVDTSASIEKFGRQVYGLSIRPEINVNTAQDFINAIVGRYQDPRPTVTLAVNNGTDNRMTQALTREISDRITVVEAQTGVNHDYWVERIEHQIDEAGLHHAVVLGCEKAAATANYAVWGTAIWGTNVWGY